jgi:diguanylate cyclase (GGDEF)-like protein/PAS domain S-box-containing protein
VSLPDASNKPRRRIERLVLLPIIGALIVMWITLGAFTFVERGIYLDKARNQLGATVSTLADFNELAEQAGGEAAARGNDARNAAIWRALLQYPTASIWVETQGKVTGGQPPPGDLSAYLLIDDARTNFVVHGALPQADVFKDWYRSMWQRGTMLLGVSAAFLLMSHFLLRALRERAAAENEAAAERERATQLALYRAQLEQTVTERTRELKHSNLLLEKELIERKAAEDVLREHDALLNVVTKSAAELLSTQYEDAVNIVLDMIGTTLGVSRVHLVRFRTDDAGILRSNIQNEWCAPGQHPMVDSPRLRDIDVTTVLPKYVLPELLKGRASTFTSDLNGTLEEPKMRACLCLPIMVEDKLWGLLGFIDGSRLEREWSWAQSDALQTLSGLFGVAITRAQYVAQLADANMIVHNSPTILYRLRGEPPFPLIYISHNIAKFGHDPKQLIGSPKWAKTLIAPADKDRTTEAMIRVLQKDAQASSIEFRMLTGDGGVRWVENRYTPIRDKDGRLVEVEGIIIDITERKTAEDKIALLARTDSLTGLANRATFIERLRQAFAAARRGADSFAILYIDLDHFKDVNDTLGHGVGDLLLREVADRLRNNTREADVIARLGGDEFAVIQTEMADPTAAASLAAKLQKSLAQPYALAGNEITVVTASIGVCPYSPSSAGPDTMLAQADLALYRSKEEGRNRFHFHSNDLDQQVQELKRALEHQQLELHYQPQVEIVSGRIVGMEALVRWNHPERGLLHASAFIPAAEKAGLTTVVGNWVLDQACRQMRKWRDEGVAPPVIAINLSLTQVRSSKELVRVVREATRRWNIEPSALEFDVTEGTLAQATLSQNDVLTQLRGLGAHIALDDFGTEYSSFEYLRAYDVSHLKIARSFVSSALDDPHSAAIIRSIVSLAHELGIGVIAEGVETKEQRTMLAATGSAPCAQGHFYSEAVDAGEAGAMLRAGIMKPMEPADDLTLNAWLLEEQELRSG